MTCHCMCNLKESECAYPKCHNGEWDARRQAPAVSAPPHSQAALDVLAERRRQIEAEGWTPEHDDEHADGELARAAAAYAAHSALGESAGRQFYGCLWPFGDGFKPTLPRRDLVKATALLLAEIERLDRADAAKTQPLTSGD